jgi:predicted dehydrogenase
VITDAGVNAVVISTRHDSHAGLAIEALKADKYVFVEKPLCLTLGDLAAIEAAAASSAGRLMVGFNRRFAPQVQRVKQLLAGAGGPKAFVMTVNAGAIPAEHWTQDREVGGGRVVGEACHFIDLLRFLAGAPITEWRRMDMAAASGDTLSLQLGV